MKIHFDDELWSQLEEYLRVAQVCGATSNELYSFAKGVAQRVIASLGVERDVPEEEAAHALAVLMTLRSSVLDAAHGFAAAADRLDALIAQVEPAAGASAGRLRRGRSRAPKT